MKNQSDFASRIGLRAVSAGVLVSFTTMLLLMILIAALGLWDFYLDEIAHASFAFWFSMSVAWLISQLMAGFVAAVAARSQSMTEGILNALCASCGSYLLFGLCSMMLTPRVFISLLSTASPEFFLRKFLTDCVGFLIALYGGILAVKFEQKSLTFRVFPSSELFKRA